MDETWYKREKRWLQKTGKKKSMLYIKTAKHTFKKLLCWPEKTLYRWIQPCLPVFFKSWNRVQFTSEEHSENMNTDLNTQLNPARSLKSQIQFWWTRLETDTNSWQGMGRLFLVGVEMGGMAGVGGKISVSHGGFLKMHTSINFPSCP